MQPPSPGPPDAQHPGATLIPEPLLNLIQDAVIVTDPALRITGWNSVAASLYGWSATEALGRSSQALLQTDYLGAERSQLLAQLQEQGVWKGEVLHRHRDGHAIRILATVSWMRGPDGAPLGALSLNRDISERARLEAALREREQQLTSALTAHQQAKAELEETARKLRALFDLLPVGVSILDAERRVAYANPALNQILQLDQDGLAHQTYQQRQYLRPDGAPMPAEEFASARAAREQRPITDVETGIVTETGETIWTSVSAAPVDFPGWRMVLVTADITARKRVEQALQRSTERLRVLAEASHTFAEAGIDYETVQDRIARTIVALLGEGCLIAHISEDGAWIQAHHVYDVDAGVQALTRSLVGGRLPIDESRTNARVFRTGQPVFVPLVDLNQMRAAAKPAYTTMIAQQNPHSLMAVPMRALGQVIGVLTLYRRDRERPAFDADDLQLVQDLADRAALAIANARLFQQAQSELAERQRAEAALEAERSLLVQRVAERTADLTVANAELARAARLKDEFLANMSHELRTPLNGILGYAELLQESIYGTLSSQQNASVAGIAEAGQHLLDLINDILDLSKFEAGKIALEPAPVNLMDLGRVVMRMVSQPALAKQIKVTSAYDSYAETMLADERRLKQILVNLLGNAVKFTPEGGKVGLEVRGDPHEQTITFTVWDTGIGIAPDDQRRIFEPFIQLDSALHREHEGTGLGLALVQRLVTLQGGSLGLESTPGLGSRFHVILPWVLPDAAPAPPPPQPEPANLEPGSIRQALVIDDSAIAARHIAYHLQELGSQVIIHQRAEGAVEIAAALQPDVIILDILLPEPVGWEVLRALKADPRTAAIPVIVVSVVDEPAAAHALGAAAALLKPVSREALTQALGALRLPAQAPTSALVLAPAAEAPPPVVLLAEDNLVNVQVLEGYLSAVGYRVVVARNGAEAVAQTLDLRPAIVLLDIQMPVLDGLEAIRRIRAAGLTELPIIAVTALAMPGDRERCLEAGADDYFTKPVGLRRLREAMARLLARPA